MPVEDDTTEAWRVRVGDENHPAEIVLPENFSACGFAKLTASNRIGIHTFLLRGNTLSRFPLAQHGFRARQVLLGIHAESAEAVIAAFGFDDAQTETMF